MRTYRSFEEAYRDLRDDIEMDVNNSSVGFISKQILKSILERMNGDIAFLERRGYSNGREDKE